MLFHVFPSFLSSLLSCLPSFPVFPPSLSSLPLPVAEVLSISRGIDAVNRPRSSCLTRDLFRNDSYITLKQSSSSDSLRHDLRIKIYKLSAPQAQLPYFTISNSSAFFGEGCKRLNLELPMLTTFFLTATAAITGKS